MYQQQQNNQVNENVSEEVQTQSKNIAGADVKENTGSGGGYGTGQGSELEQAADMVLEWVLV